MKKKVKTKASPCGGQPRGRSLLSFLLCRWAIYLAALGGMAAFAVNYTGWVSHYIFLVTLFLPLVSLLLTLLGWRGIRVDIAVPDTVRRGEAAEAQIHIIPRAGFRWYPLCLPVLLSADAGTQAGGGRRYHRFRPCDGAGDGGDRLPYMHIPLDTAHTGLVRIGIFGVYVTDPMGLFPLPLHKGGLRREMLILPHATPPVHAPDLSGAGQGPLVPATGFSEQTEIRTYRPGDPMRSVHWKLSAKTDTVLVREAMEHRRRTITVTFDRPAEAYAADAVYDCLDYTLRALCTEDGSGQILLLWQREGGITASAAIYAPEDLLAAYRALFGSRQFGDGGEASRDIPYTGKSVQKGYHIDAGCRVRETAVARP